MLFDKDKEEMQVTVSKIKDVKEIMEDLIRIYSSAYRGLEEYAYTRRSDIKGYIRWLNRADRDGGLIAKDKERIVGFIFFCHNWWDRIFGEIGEIHELAVDPEYQGKGIGKMLMNEAMNSMRKYHNIFGLWVGEKNRRAIEFYKKLGFSERGKVGKWIRMIREEY